MGVSNQAPAIIDALKLNDAWATGPWSGSAHMCFEIQGAVVEHRTHKFELSSAPIERAAEDAIWGAQ